jgi:hypothetical protein
VKSPRLLILRILRVNAWLWVLSFAVVCTWAEATRAQSPQPQQSDEDEDVDVEPDEKQAAEPSPQLPSAPVAQPQTRKVVQPPPPPQLEPEIKKEETPETLGPLERLPDSAYPEPCVRGLKGGSLWATFHGLQWPYYRKSGIGVSGYVWIDTGYEQVEMGDPTVQDAKYVLQQGRVLLRVTPTYSSGQWFVQGQAELVVNKDQSSPQPLNADADDVWVRAGMWDGFDLQLGRFEAWEVYHFGMGLDLNTIEREGASYRTDGIPDIYGVTYAFYRPQNVGQAALHIYPTNYLRFELGSHIGSEDGLNTVGGRPVGVLDLGWLKFKVGGEYKWGTSQDDGMKTSKTARGAGAAIQFVFDPWVEFGVNGAKGIVDRTSSDGTVDEKGSFDVYSFGGFANVHVVGDLLAGAGANLTKQEDIHYDRTVGDVGHFDHFQTFVALQYIFIKHLYVKLVLAYAKGNVKPTFGEPIFGNEMLSARLRLMYLF